MSGKAQPVNRLDVSAAPEPDRQLFSEKAAEAEAAKAARAQDASAKLEQLESQLRRAQALVRRRFYPVLPSSVST